MQWHPAFQDFARYYGYTPRACQPYRARTKGKVESGVTYVKRNALAGRGFDYELRTPYSTFWCWRSWGIYERWPPGNRLAAISRTAAGSRLNPRASIRRSGTGPVKIITGTAEQSLPCRSCLSSVTHRNTGKTRRDAGEAASDRSLYFSYSRSRLRSNPL